MSTFVILLRGVTPTGKNKVLMGSLRAALSEAGLKDIRTYIQSGNVIATSPLSAREVEKLVHDVIRRSLGGDIAVLARTPTQFSRILQRNPFPGADGTKLYFTLLAAAPDRKLLKELVSNDFAPDRVQYADNTIYTLYATRYSDSRFNNNFFERRLGVAATTRNLNTMTRLAAMTARRESAPIDTRGRPR